MSCFDFGRPAGKRLFDMKHTVPLQRLAPIPGYLTNTEDSNFHTVQGSKCIRDTVNGQASTWLGQVGFSVKFDLD